MEATVSRFRVKGISSISFADSSLDADVGGAVAGELAGEDDGAADEEVGEFGGKTSVACMPPQSMLRVGQGGVADAVEEGVHDGSASCVEAEVGDGAAADLGHVVEQVAVDAGADAEGEDADWSRGAGESGRGSRPRCR